jgi:hypothetical protein
MFRHFLQNHHQGIRINQRNVFWYNIENTRISQTQLRSKPYREVFKTEAEIGQIIPGNYKIKL